MTATKVINRMIDEMQKPKSDRCGIYVSELDRKLLTE
jgi:hypothetical protein